MKTNTAQLCHCVTQSRTFIIILERKKKSIWLILKKMVLNVMKYEELERLRLFLLWKPAAVSNIYICKFNVNSKCILHTITKEINLISPLAPSEARILCFSVTANLFVFLLQTYEAQRHQWEISRSRLWCLTSLMVCLGRWLANSVCQPRKQLHRLANWTPGDLPCGWLTLW